MIIQAIGINTLYDSNLELFESGIDGRVYSSLSGSFPLFQKGRNLYLRKARIDVINLRLPRMGNSATNEVDVFSNVGFIGSLISDQTIIPFVDYEQWVNVDAIIKADQSSSFGLQVGGLDNGANLLSIDNNNLQDAYKSGVTIRTQIWLDVEGKLA